MTLEKLLPHVLSVLEHAYVRCQDDDEPFCQLWNAYEDTTGEKLNLSHLPRTS